MKYLFALVLLALAGCVGNKADTKIVGLEIERKPSPSEEAQGWLNVAHSVFNPMRNKHDGTDSKPE